MFCSTGAQFPCDYFIFHITPKRAPKYKQLLKSLINVLVFRLEIEAE